MPDQTRELLHLLLRLEVEKWVRDSGRLDLILVLYRSRHIRENRKSRLELELKLALKRL